MDDRRKKLRFRAWRRGFREIDFILGRFADERLADLDEAGLDAFEALMHAPDGPVYDWITGQAPPPAEYDTPTLAALQAFASSSAPSPLVGEGREGGRAAWRHDGQVDRPPPPSPQGGGGPPIDPATP